MILANRHIFKKHRLILLGPYWNIFFSRIISQRHMEVFPLIFFFFSLRSFFSPFSRHSVIIFFFFAVSLELGFCIVESESELESFLFFSFLLSSFFWDVHHIGFFFLIGFLFLLASSLSSSSKFDTFFLLPFFLQVAF